MEFETLVQSMAAQSPIAIVLAWALNMIRTRMEKSDKVNENLFRVIEKNTEANQSLKSTIDIMYHAINAKKE